MPQLALLATCRQLANPRQMSGSQREIKRLQRRRGGNCLRSAGVVYASLRAAFCICCAQAAAAAPKRALPCHSSRRRRRTLRSAREKMAPPTNGAHGLATAACPSNSARRNDQRKPDATVNGGMPECQCKRRASQRLTPSFVNGHFPATAFGRRPLLGCKGFCREITTCAAC